MKEAIGVVGLWHLGCVLSASWSKLGNSVVGFDYSKERVENLRKGVPPLFEPKLAEMITEQISKKTLSFSSDIQSLMSCDFIFLSYDTPVNEDDSSDTSLLTSTVTDLSKIMKNNSVLIISSQSPVGFCQSLRAILKGADSSLEVVYSPENLRLGEAIQCYLEPGRIILGTADKNAEEKCKRLFSQIKADIFSMSLESAEMVKHGINSFLANSIVFANHLADICELKGAKIEDVVRGIKSDPRIGLKAYLSPGIGFSGGTLGRDLKVLESENLKGNGYAKLFGTIHQMNLERKYSIVDRCTKILNDLKGKTISILGVTYKPGTSTLRRSLPLEIVDHLLEKGASVKVFDPKADFSELNKKPIFSICRSIEDVIEKSDLVLLLTEWPEFKKFEWGSVSGKMRSAVLFDTKNYLDEKTITSAGFKYYSVGR